MPRSRSGKSGRAASLGRDSLGRDAGPQGASQRQLRVGEELRHVVARLLERGVLRDPAVAGRSCRARRCRAGSMKAAVLPEPVCEQAMMSRPSMAAGTTCACTGVGTS